MASLPKQSVTDLTWTPDPDALRGRVAVVAGATRGAGRGIASALGEVGATVICTGRSSTARNLKSDYPGRSETIEETADLVTSLGGIGVAIAVDHLESEQVSDLADQIRSDHGRIDILVNDIWGGETLTGDPDEWGTTIWESDLDGGLRLLRLAIDTHLITSHHLLPMLVQSEIEGGGLLVEVTDGTTSYNAANYRISVFYDLAKTAVNRIAWSQGHELASHGATAVAVTPGWLRSEMMLEAFNTTEETWPQADAPPGFATSESPRFVGRAIAAMGADRDRSRWNQQSVTVGELARHYGFHDVDGSRPDAWGYITDSGQDPDVDPQKYR